MTTRAKSISITIYRNSICKYIINLLKNDKFYPNFNIFYRLSINITSSHMLLQSLFNIFLHLRKSIFLPLTEEYFQKILLRNSQFSAVTEQYMIFYPNFSLQFFAVGEGVAYFGADGEVVFVDGVVDDWL